jgi:nucleoside-diphosphate-sugar epimerase
VRYNSDPILLYVARRQDFQSIVASYSKRERMPKRKKLFVTGAAGRVGSALCQHLRDRYDLRLLYHSTIPENVPAEDEIVVSDVTDFPAMLEATEGIDVIVHLALSAWGHRGFMMLEARRARLTFDVDIKGTYHLFEAARINSVPTVIYASTNHVTGINEKEGILSHPDLPVRPDSIYGAGKAFGEALGRYYVDVHGLRVFCLRIANFNGRDEPGRHYEPGQSRWLSPRDLAQLTWRCIEADDLNWGIFYGVSRGAEAKWDISNAQELLGYEPEDDGSALMYRQRYQA